MRCRQRGIAAPIALDAFPPIATGAAKRTPMPRKPALDATGTTVLLAVMLLFAGNQAIIKLVNTGLQPVFFAALRSLMAVCFVAAWMRYRGLPLDLTRAMLPAGLLIGTMFSAEFLFLFVALDMTTLGRASVIFYSMPVWFALMAHYGLPGERITRVKAVGLALAMAGTAVAILSRGDTGQGSFAGDLCALGGAIGWAATAFVARSPRMAAAGPERQLFWMVLVSGPILLAASPLFGPLVRDLQPSHIWWLLFQASVVVTGGFITWLWLLSAYPAATVASFSFLTPIFAIILGALLFDESVDASLALASGLVAVGIVAINRKG
jgi:drug/metabolite transporter (DMT)-like permease